MAARFRIKRMRPYNAADVRPWKLKDTQRPAYLGQFPTLARALREADNRVRIEMGLEPRIDWPTR